MGSHLETFSPFYNLHLSDEKTIRGAAAVAVGVQRLKTADALDIQNKSLNGSMSEILNVKQCTKGKIS